MGRVSSREKLFIRGADAVEKSRRQHGMMRYGEHCVGPTRSKTSRTHESHLLGNREIPWTADARCRVEARIGKDASVNRFPVQDEPLAGENSRAGFVTLAILTIVS